MYSQVSQIRVSTVPQQLEQAHAITPSKPPARRPTIARARAECDEMEPRGSISSHSRAPEMRVAGGMTGPADSSWTHHALVLLRQKFERLYVVMRARQQGH